MGSDPARLSTTAEKTPAGDAYILNGTKLWCTNGTLAKLLVVMAVHPPTGGAGGSEGPPASKSGGGVTPPPRKIGAFVVETAWKGVKVEHRSRFMGLRALANAVISFKDVRVPAENLIGVEGKGLKIALTTLNDGRLSIPAGSVGTAKVCLEICRRWANQRVQWGMPIGKHEAIAHKIASMAAHAFAMESVSNLASEMSDRGGYDIRLEAAAAKEWNTDRCWEIVDDTMQIRGGRGYETERSLQARGEEPDPRGADHARLPDQQDLRGFQRDHAPLHGPRGRGPPPPGGGGPDRSQEGPGGQAGGAAGDGGLLRLVVSHALAGLGPWPRYAGFGRLAPHLRFVERSSRKLARQSFHGMLRHQGRLQNKQAFLFRLVDVANELFAMAASICRARAMADEKRPEAAEAAEMADLFCRTARRRVARLFEDLWSNDDVAKYRTALDVLGGRHAWLERGILGLEGAMDRKRQAVAEPADLPVASVQGGLIVAWFLLRLYP